MNTRHEHEKKQFKRLFSQEGVDQLDKRFQVLETFLTTEQHVTCREIEERLAQDGFQAGMGFVAETMELLCRFGFAHRLTFGDGPPRFEHRHLGLHHDHMVCTKCGSILEFRDEALEQQQVKLSEAYDFHLLQHKMELYGICAPCRKTRAHGISLDKAKPGESLVITGLNGGKKAQMRLTSMGLRTGDHIEVVSTQPGGQLVIAVGESRFVIGQGFSHKIQVRHPAVSEMDAQTLPNTDVSSDTPAAASPIIPLSEMKQGQEGVVVRVGGKNLLRRRILEMGINRGTRIYVEKYAPLKDPLELIVKGYHISLRVRESAHISVENVKTVEQ